MDQPIVYALKHAPASHESTRAVSLLTLCEDGYTTTEVTLRWSCPICGQRRGEPEEHYCMTKTPTGWKQIVYHSWENNCGHADRTVKLLIEAVQMEVSHA